jgi:hypothetical protein
VSSSTVGRAVSTPDADRPERWTSPSSSSSHLPALRSDLERILDFAEDLERRATTTEPPDGARRGLLLSPPALPVPVRQVPVPRPPAQFDLRRAALVGLGLVVGIALLLVAVEVLGGIADDPSRLVDGVDGEVIPPVSDTRVTEVAGGGATSTPSSPCTANEVAASTADALGGLTTTVTSVRCEGDFALARVNLENPGNGVVDSWLAFRIAPGTWQILASGWVADGSWTASCASITAIDPSFPVTLCV